MDPRDLSDELREAIDAVNAFLADELTALRASFRAPDEETWREAASRAESHLHIPPGSLLTLGFDRPPGGWPEAQRSLGDELVERPLYAVTRHAGEGGRPVFRAFVGNNRGPGGFTYAQALHLAEVDGRLKIVGRAGASPFESPEVLKWEDLGGDQLEDAGPPVEVAKLRRPRKEAAAAHWDALEAAP